MDGEALSIVVPARNEERYIGPCLSALLQQQEDILEIIVVDNNSTDNTVQIVEAVAAGNPIVRLVTEKRPGVAFARNAAERQFAGARDMTQSVAALSALLSIGKGEADPTGATRHHGGLTRLDLHSVPPSRLA